MVTWGSPMTYDPMTGPFVTSERWSHLKRSNSFLAHKLFHQSLDDRLSTLFFGIETPLVITGVKDVLQSIPIFVMMNPTNHNKSASRMTSAVLLLRIQLREVPHHTPVAPVSGGTILVTCNTWWLNVPLVLSFLLGGYLKTTFNM